jgi:hypothetical protein
MPDDAPAPVPGDVPLPGIGRYGEPTAAGGVSFRCGACGETAAMVKLLPARGPVNMGPPLGSQQHSRDGLVIDCWLGSTSWIAVDPDTWTQVRDVLGAGQPDPAALHDIDWEFAPFFCRACRICYCRGDWHGIPVWDGPFYDYTEGHCPAGHRQIIDD